MTEVLRPVRPEDVAELGRICYEAFKDLTDRHGFPNDFSSVAFAQQVIGMQTQNEGVYSVGAFSSGASGGGASGGGASGGGGQAMGSNFINMWGDVAGIGPISVDIGAQGAGLGRQLMQDVIEKANVQGFEMIRLCQDSFNMQSLALYSSLGFVTREPLAYLALASDGRPDPAIRPATTADLPAIDELCREIYRVSRKGECETLLAMKFPAFVLDRGHVSGYLVSTAMGHGVAESDDDMLALLAGHGAALPDAHSFVPIRNGELYRRALAAGHKNVKLMNLMSLGPYEEPQGAYAPSVMF